MYRDGHIFLYSVMGGVVHIVNWEGEGFKNFFVFKLCSWLPWRMF